VAILRTRKCGRSSTFSKVDERPHSLLLALVASHSSRHSGFGPITRSSGYRIDGQLWMKSDPADCNMFGEGDKCSQCHAGCTDSPKIALQSQRLPGGNDTDRPTSK
jgi:hypothetical protein